MNEGLITVRYAKALFQAAEEENVVKVVNEDMDFLLVSMHESKEFVNFLTSPLIQSSKKIAIIKEIFQKNVHILTLRFLLLLVENKREAFLEGMCRNFLVRYKKSQGIKEAVFTTAYSLDEKNIKNIKKDLSEKFNLNIELKAKTDPSIIGGFILRIEDEQIDASLKHQLNKIKRELITI